MLALFKSVIAGRGGGSRGTNTLDYYLEIVTKNKTIRITGFSCVPLICYQSLSWAEGGY
jgi:hypothetical protein